MTINTTTSKAQIFIAAHKVAKAMKANKVNAETAYSVCLSAALSMVFAAAKQQIDNFDEVVNGMVAAMAKVYAHPKQITAERVVRETPKAYFVNCEVATYRRFDVMTGKRLREISTMSVWIAKSQVDEDGYPSDWIISQAIDGELVRFLQ